MLTTSNVRAWLHGAIVALVLGTAVALIAQQPVTVSNVPHVIVDTAPSTAVTGTVAATQSGTWTLQPGNTPNTTPWLTTIQQGGNAAVVNGSGQLSITCANCSGSGASAVDNSAFTAGTTSGAPAMGFYHATIDPVTDGRAATLAIDSKRNLFTVLRDAAGNARGVNVTAGNALTVDGSAVTQPVSGTVTTTPPANASTNVSQMNGVTVLMGNGIAGTGAQRVTIASDNTAFSVNATIANPSPSATEAATYATGGTTIPIVIPFTQIYGAGGSSTWGRLTAGQAAMNASLPVTIASNQTALAVTAPGTTATTTDTALTSYLTSAASTNATSVKASAGNVYLLRLVNTTATLYYLRMYNLAAAPTCSSATGFVETIPIPASATGAGIVSPQSVGQSYTTGIAYCLTGGGSSTDNTNAATGVYVTVLYK